MKARNNDGRLLSLDALRGLDMLFLVGFAGIFRALPEVSNNKFRAPDSMQKNLNNTR